MLRKIPVVLMMLLLSLTVHADFGGEVKLLASDGAASDLLGVSVSISGDTAIVGASKSSDTGAAYVFVRDSDGIWIEQQKLLASDGVAGDYFGRSISISGDTAIVGAIGYLLSPDTPGFAYIFVRGSDGNWTQQQKLLASDGAIGDVFGISVSLSGDTAIIGAHRNDDNGDDTGSAYVFIRDANGNWTEQQKLLASDGAANTAFGRAVSISGDTAMVGTPGDNASDPASGSVYVFIRDVNGDWTQQQKLLASDGSDFDYFGISVSINGDTAIAGASGHDDNGFSSSGAAYVFVRDSDGIWAEQQELLTSDTALADSFGGAVSISNDTTIVGAYNTDDNGLSSGSAYIFMRDPDTSVWTEQQKLLTSDGMANDYFGGAVSISADTVIVGAGGTDDNGSLSGSAYVYHTIVPVPDITVIDSVVPNNDSILPFGDITEQAYSDQIVTVTNDGNADLTLGSIAVADALLSPFTIEINNCSGQVLTPASNCTITVRFAPQSTGSFNDSFDIPSDDPDESSVIVNVSGMGTGLPVPDIRVTDTIVPADDLDIDFGNITQASILEQTISIANNGNANLLIGNIATQDILESPFSILNDACSNTIVVPATSCTLTVRFEPTGAGVFNDSFDIPSDDTDEASLTFNLTGTGTALPTPDIAVSDLRISFGDVTEGTSSDQAVTVSNAGTADLDIGQIAQVNSLAVPFTLRNDNCSMQTLAPATSCTFMIRFSPTYENSFKVNFNIPSNDVDENPAVISVYGSGIAVPVTPDPDPADPDPAPENPGGGGGAISGFILLVSMLLLVIRRKH